MSSFERRETLCKYAITQKVSHSSDRKHLSLTSCLKNATLLGQVPKSSKYLAIGIPSVQRPKENYLLKTLQSLTSSLDDDERESLTIVVLLADADYSLRQKRAREVMKSLRNEVDSGLILLVQTNDAPRIGLRITRRTFNDSLERVRWRSKQALDFAFLLSCSQELSEYFLILEDDVEASPHYVNTIRSFVTSKRGQDWTSLTFSRFLIIGRLFKSSLLQRLSDFVVMFHLEQPVDLLVLQFLDLMVQDKSVVTRRIPSLFQHMGLFSSLPGKIQKAKDLSYSTAERYGNPPADVVTTLKVYKRHDPELCYVPSTDFFWGGSPKVNDTFEVVLHKPVKARRIKVVSGSPDHKNDMIKFAELKVSASFNRMISNNKANCSDFRTLAFFDRGAVEMTFNNLTQLVFQCLRIEFLQKQSNWILIKDVIIQTA